MGVFMSEALFILTTTYIAYVVFVVTEGEKNASRHHPKREKAVNQTFDVIADAPVESMTSAAAPTIEPVAAEPAPIVATVKPQMATKNTQSVRNPKTGEISKVTSYPFTKRWIKEALVREGLLEKIYTNAELNDTLNVKIKQALETLKEMPGYQA